MFDIYLFTFAKKENSTKQPSLTGQTPFQCDIKSPSSLISPLIELHSNTNPVAFNYAYIPEFRRYFFVSDWRYDRGLWFANLSVDVLATYKPYIGDTNMYITRSSAEYDPYTADSFYPNTYSHTHYLEELSQTPLSWDDGNYIVNTLSNQANGIMSYCVTPQGFNTFIGDLCTTIDGYDWGDATKALFNGITNPIQYLVSCYWFPNSFSGTITGGIRLGLDGFNAGANCKIVDTVQGFSITANLHKHPKANTIGKFLNAEPFTYTFLSLGPMGRIKLDSSLLVDASKIIIGGLIDPATGVAEINVEGYDSSNNALGMVLQTSAPWGVPIALSKESANTGGLVSGIVNTGIAMATTPGSSIVGKAAIGALGLGGNIISAVDNLTSSSVRTTQAGSFASHNGPKQLEQFFFDIVDVDNANNGRPLCKIRKPSALGGYMVAEKCVLDCPATDGELAELRRYVETGFYYE